MNDEEIIREIATKAFREALEARSQELAEDIAGRMKAALQPQTTQHDRSKALRDGTLLIAGSRTQTESLEALLAASSAIADGCGLLILRGAQAGGWNCQGITALDNFKRAILDCSRGVVAHAIASCTTAETLASELDPFFVARLDLDAGARVALLPVLLKGHVAALLLALVPEGDEAPALEVLVQVTQLVLDVQAYRRATPKAAVEAHSAAPPAVAVAETHVAPPSSEPAPVQTEPTVVESAQPTPVPVEQVVAAQPPPQLAPEPIYVPAPEPEPVAAQTAVVVSQPSREQAYLPAAREPEPVAAPVAEPQPEAVPAYAPVVSSPVVVSDLPPEPVAIPAAYVAPTFHQVSTTPPSISAPQDPSHEKARRFAKLLVEEIKLYNQGKVAEGRARGDLYSRLREDIEKSRAAYHKRYGETIRDVDYFSQELMRILADNNRSVMGAGFPG